MTATETPDVTEAPPGLDLLYTALAAFQAELPTMGKDQQGVVEGESKDGKRYKYSYKYADLGDISPPVLRLLGKHGLSWFTKPTMRGEKFVLLYKLAHSSGQAEVGEWPLPEPSRCTAQQLGGAITYARRYSLCAVTGVAPGGDDDDAQAASQRPADGAANRAPRTPAEAARAEIIAAMEAAQLDPTAVLTGYKRRHSVDLRQDDQIERLREFAAWLRHDPDAALAVDPATGQPTGPRAVPARDAS